MRSCVLRRRSPSAGETAQRLCRLCAIRMERRFTDCTFAEAMTMIRGEGGLKLQVLLELLQPETFTVGEDGNFAVRTPVLAAPKLVSRSVAAWVRCSCTRCVRLRHRINQRVRGCA